MGRVMQIDCCLLSSSTPADPSVCFSLIPGKDFRVEPITQVQAFSWQYSLTFSQLLSQMQPRMSLSQWMSDPVIRSRFSLRCVSRDCGQPKERLMLNFNIPLNKIWYFYHSRSINWQYASHDFIADLRPETSRCIDETAFSTDSGYYPTPAALKDETHLSVNSSNMDLQSDLKVYWSSADMRQHFRGFPSLKPEDSLCNASSCGLDR